MGEMDRAYTAQRTSQSATGQNAAKAPLIDEVNQRIPVTETKLRENGFPIFPDVTHAIRYRGHNVTAYVYPYAALLPGDPRRAVAFYVDGVGTARFLKCDALVAPDSEFVDANLQDDFEPELLRTLSAWLLMLQKAPKVKPWVVSYLPPLPI